MTRCVYGSAWETQLQHDLEQSGDERYEKSLQTHLSTHTPHVGNEQGFLWHSIYRRKTLKEVALGWENISEKITQYR